jgi:D-tyrosyl-tRNA(Tyr) deacylase
VRIVVQRVSSASVRVEGSRVASIGSGLLLLVGIAADDDAADVAVVAAKVAGLRVFPDREGRMNLSVEEIGGEILLVSQFTLLGDVARGRRPSFSGAAPPERAEALVGVLADALRDRGLPVSEGVFGARMEVELVNDGPVTLVLEVEEGKVR